MPVCVPQERGTIPLHGRGLPPFRDLLPQGVCRRDRHAEGGTAGVGICVGVIDHYVLTWLFELGIWTRTLWHGF